MCDGLSRNHRGKRSIRTEATKYIFDVAYQDHIICETINLATQDEIINHLQGKYEHIQMSEVPKVEVAEVLLDSLGRGSFQRAEGVNK